MLCFAVRVFCRSMLCFAVPCCVLLFWLLPTERRCSAFDRAPSEASACARLPRCARCSRWCRGSRRWPSGGGCGDRPVASETLSRLPCSRCLRSLSFGRLRLCSAMRVLRCTPEGLRPLQIHIFRKLWSWPVGAPTGLTVVPVAGGGGCVCCSSCFGVDSSRSLRVAFLLWFFAVGYIVAVQRTRSLLAILLTLRLTPGFAEYIVDHAFGTCPPPSLGE